MHQITDKALDPDEVARFRSRPGDPAAIIRFALHVQSRDPASVWAPMALAKFSGSPEERLYSLWEAVRAGRRRWEPETQARTVAWWDEPETRPFLMALYAYAQQSARMGFRDDAASSVAEMLKLDPQDHLGAETLAKAMGLIPEAEADRVSTIRM